MIGKLFSLLKGKSHPLNIIYVNKNQLIKNYQYLKSINKNIQIAPVLKSNAYGHGLVEIATILEKEKDTPFLVIDSHFEMRALRSAGIKRPLLVIGYVQPEIISRSNIKNVSFTITTIETLYALGDIKNQKINIHLKIDIGMHRQGLNPEEIPESIKLIKNHHLLFLEGITSHLSDADNKDPDFTKQQIKRWNEIVKTFKETFPGMKYVHLSATHGHRFSALIDANVSRLGIGLYGLEDGQMFSPVLEQKPVMQMKTIITSVKTLLSGESIGYNNTFKVKQSIRIATIPCGYFEGIDQRLSNNGFVLVGPSRIPCMIIGKVSMNISTLDVSSVPNVKVGMNVVVISNNSIDPNSISSISKLCHTNTYGITVRFPAHLKRVVVDQN